MIHRVMIILIAILFILNVALFVISHAVPIFVDGKASKERPLRFQDNKMYWSRVCDYAVCGENIYFLYDSKKVLVCFDLDGNYLHSYLLDMPSKGHAELHTANNTLYVESTDHHLYAFPNAKFSRFLDREADSDQIQQIRQASAGDTQGKELGESYEFRNTSLWRVEQNGSATKVVHRSPWLAVFQNDIIFLIIHAFCIVCFVFLWRKINGTNR